MAGGETGKDVQTRARLQAENQHLRAQVRALRHFIHSMEHVMEACAAPRGEAEILELLAEVLATCLRTISAKDGSLLVLDEESGELVFVLGQGDIPQEHLAWRRLPPGEGIAGWVVAHRQPTIVNNVQADHRFSDVLDTDLGFVTESILAVPLTGGGKVLGVVEVLNKRDGMRFTTEDQVLLTLMCRFAGELLYTLIQQSAELTEPGRSASLV